MRVFLADTPVGTLRRDREDRWRFRLLDSYRRLHPRPVLGQIFEDDLSATWQARHRLPPFFSNLLPEGALRQVILRSTHVAPHQEGALLARLGEDLPGAIVVRPEDDGELHLPSDDLSSESGEAEGGEDSGQLPLKFSLAGIQLKLAVVQDEDRLTVPAAGVGGDWIAKLPSPQYPSIPQVEYSMLRWARHVGLEVPDHDLVAVSDIARLPAEIGSPAGEALLVRRFDRTRSGRVHQEDFAQVLNVYPEHKYGTDNHDVLGRIVYALTGREGFLSYVQRLVFVVLSGNGDAHLKNWSLRYPDGHTAQLSPVYDQVFTRAFLPDDSLALNIGGEKRFERIAARHFQRLADKAGVPSEIVDTAVRDFGERVRIGWSDIRDDLPLPDDVKTAVDRHLSHVQL